MHVTKICSSCLIKKSHTEFYLCKSRNKFKLSHMCIPCSSKRRKKYYQENRDYSIKQSQRYADLHKTEVKERMRQYYLKNRHKQLQSAKDFRKDNPEIMKERHRIKHERYKRKVYTFFINLLQTYPILITYIAKRLEFRDINANIASKLRGRINKKLRKRNLKQTLSMDLIGCSIDDLRLYIESLWKPGMSWDNHGVGPGHWQFDHIKPCCSFYLTNLEQQKQCFHYTNLQPLWFDEHRRKTTNDIKSKVKT